MAARDMGANEKVWIEGFRRNLVHRDGATSIRPDAATVAGFRALLDDLDLAAVYAAARCPMLLVLPTRSSPDQEPFADLYAAYRRFRADQAAAVARAAPRFRFRQLEDASHAMIVERPGALAAIIADFLADPPR